MIYQELKDYFETAELPQTLDGAHKYYCNVPYTVDLYINCIQRQIRVHGRDVRKSNIARTYKRNLQELYDDLQVKENWNVGLKRLEEKKRM